MLSEVKERFEGPKNNNDFGGKGLGRQGKGIGMSTMQKVAILWKCLNTFVPRCRSAVINQFCGPYPAVTGALNMILSCVLS